MYHLLDRDLESQLTKLASGSTVKHISVNDCKKILIKVPPIELQKKFSKIYDKSEQQRKKLEKSLREMIQIYNSIMQKAFRGELFN